MMRPEFSLLVPSYDRPEFLRETVASFLSNATGDYEVIISDNDSPRKAEISAALREYQSNNNIRLIFQETNRGPCANFNALFSEARGEWVILISDDDRLKVNALSRIRWWQEKAPGHDVYGFGFDVIDPNGAYIYQRCSPRPITYDMKKDNSWKELFAFSGLGTWSHHPFTMAIKRERAQTLGFSESADLAEDVLFVFEVLQEGGSLFVIPESLFEWRRPWPGKQSYTTLSCDMGRLRLGRFRVWRELLRNEKTLPEVRQLVLDEAYITEFMRISKSVAHQLRERQMREGRIDESPEDPLIKSLSGRIKEGPVTRLSRLIRVAKVLGPGHFLSVARYYVDMAQYHRRFHGW